MTDLPGSTTPCTFICTLNSLEKVIKIPITYQVGKPSSIAVIYFLNRVPLVNNMKKFPLEILACCTVLNMPDSNTPTLKSNNIKPKPPPIK